MELSLGCPPVHSPPLMGSGDWTVLSASPASGGESLSPHWFSAVVIVSTAESRADGIMANIDLWLTFGRRFPFTVAVAVKQDRRLAWSSLKWRKSNWSWRQDSNQPQGKFSLYQDNVSLKGTRQCFKIVSPIRPGSVWSCLSFFGSSYSVSNLQSTS